MVILSRRLGAVAIAVLVTAIALPVQANVSLKNGNFFVGYIDIVFPGGFEPKIERVYNSKTPYKGIFGWGWGNEYEGYLTVSADGSIVANEWGSGAENRFVPEKSNPADLNRAVSMIAEAAKSTGAIGGQQQLETYSKKLLGDATFRNDEWEKYRRAGKVEARNLPINSKLISNRFSYQYIIKIKDGYNRFFDSGKVENYDERGKLRKISDKNGNFISLSYANDGKLEKIVDNQLRKIFLQYNKQGYVSRVQDETGKKEATYKYSDEGELIYSKDTAGNVYTFKYSTDKRRNLVEVGYGDKTTMQVAYYGREQNESVKAVKERDGAVTEYGYSTDPRDKNHLSVAVKVKGSDTKLLSESKYEYFLKHKKDGEEWTYRMVSVVDGDRTETTYNECCGAPIEIKKNGEATSFAYDVKGRVTKKVTPSDITELNYDQKAGKVAKVVRYPKSGKRVSSWSEFKYDERANLVFARNSQGKGVRLFYDLRGRIKSMIDQNKRTIEFEYNEDSKPVVIRDPSMGTINVSYKQGGEINKVESAGGRNVASQVTSSFQNLLDIIKPAGVTLAF